MNNLFSAFKPNLITVFILTLSFILLFSGKISAQDLDSKVDTVTATDIVLKNTYMRENLLQEKDLQLLKQAWQSKYQRIWFSKIC